MKERRLEKNDVRMREGNTAEGWKVNSEKMRRKAGEGNDEKNIKWEKGVVDQKRGIRYMHFSVVNQSTQSMYV